MSLFFTHDHREAKHFGTPKKCANAQVRLHPGFCAECHWGIVVFEFDWQNNKATAYVYDPTNMPDMRGIITATWESYTKPLIDVWHARDHGEPTIETIQVIVKEPMQADGHNCGFLCMIAVMALIEDARFDTSYLEEIASLHDDNETVYKLNDVDLQAFRLRVLHLILKSADRVDVNAESSDKAKLDKINDEIKKHCSYV